MIELTTLHGHGVFLRREALGHGYTDEDLRQAVRSGFIARVRHGAYVAAPVWAEADDVRRHVLRCHAVLATHGEGVALTHTSAAALHGLAIWPTSLLGRVHLTRLDGRTTRVCHDIVYHRGHVPERHLVPLAGGGWISSPPRAAIEHSSLTSVEGSVVCLDSFLRARGEGARDDMHDANAARAGWPRSRHLRIALGLARPGAESVGESRMRFLFWENHLPMPDLQVRVHDDRGELLGISDFGWEGAKLLGEFDGKVKYERLLRPGETSADALFREKRREDQMREFSGCSMIRFIWSDLYAREQSAARLRRALGRA